MKFSVPELCSNIMPLLDERRNMGKFILSGSQNFHLQGAISQSIARRCATSKLLIENGEKLLPIEIKSAQTVASSMFSGLDY